MARRSIVPGVSSNISNFTGLMWCRRMLWKYQGIKFKIKMCERIGIFIIKGQLYGNFGTIYSGSGGADKSPPCHFPTQ